jgi:hypothetical protein
MSDETLSIYYVAYTPDGRIKQAGTCDPGLLYLHGAPGTMKVVTTGEVDCNKYYVKTTPRDGALPLIEVLPRADNPASISGGNLVDVPVGSQITINGSSPYDITESLVELDFPNAGAYKIKITCWPFYDKELEVLV